MNKLIALGFFVLIALTSLEAQVVKIACVGNSITYGAGIQNREKMSYPAQLQAWLGSKYEVRNFGVSGSTMLKNGDKPYWQEPQYQEALVFNPDIVIIKLGTNDSKPQNWKFGAEFGQDYLAMVESFRALESNPRILLALPVPVFADRWGIRDSVVRNQIIPVIRSLSKETRCQYIDLYTPLLDYKYAFPDDIHPNSIGAAVMVEHIYRALFHRDKQHSSGYLNTAVLPAPGAECRGASAGWGEGKDWYSQFEDITRIGAERQVDLVLLGNSITQGWGGEGRTVWQAAPELWDSLFRPLNAANFGISGDKTQHVLWRIQNGNFDQVKPKVIALEIGVNNFAGNTAKEVAGGIQSIIRALQKRVPAAKILLFGPLPAGAGRQDTIRQQYAQVHQLIKGYHNGKTVFYKSLDQQFIQADGSLIDGLLAPDGIHLTAAGYRAWAGVLVPEARQLMKK